MGSETNEILNSDYDLVYISCRFVDHKSKDNQGKQVKRKRSQENDSQPHFWILCLVQTCRDETSEYDEPANNGSDEWKAESTNC